LKPAFFSMGQVLWCPKSNGVTSQPTSDTSCDVSPSSSITGA
jgi:hypothetical protein